jgi:DHA1 family inner membrane transport protein
MPDIRKELRVLTRPEVLMAMATTVMGAGAMFTLYTYIAPVLQTLTGASTGFVTLALMLIGIGFTIGNALGGRLADWSLDGATKLFLAALAVIMLALPLLLPVRPAHWSACWCGASPPSPSCRRCRSASCRRQRKHRGWPRRSTSAPSTWAMRWARPSAAA